MKNICSKLSARWVICCLLVCTLYGISYCQQTRITKVHQLYDSLKSYQIDNPETVLASAIFETGWLECTDCSLNINNLFGFRLDSGYIVFSNYSQCLAYMKKWQQAFYIPWKAKHPDLSYYEFLTHVNYAQNMPDYIKNIKALEQWIWQNFEGDKIALTKLYYTDALRFLDPSALFLASRF